MSDKFFDVAGDRPNYYRLEPKQIRDVFVKLSPASRVKQHLMERRRRKQIEVEDAVEQADRPELSAFMIDPKYRSEPRSSRHMIRDINISTTSAKTSKNSDGRIPVIQYSQLSWPTATMQHDWRLSGLNVLQSNVNDLTDLFAKYMQLFSQKLKSAWASTKEYSRARLHPFGMPRTSVHYDVISGSQSQTMYHIKRATKVALPAALLLLILALPGFFDFGSSSQSQRNNSNESSRGMTVTSDDQRAGNDEGSANNPSVSTDGENISPQAASGAPDSATTGTSTTQQQRKTTSSTDASSSSPQQPTAEGGMGGGEQPTDTTEEPAPSVLDSTIEPIGDVLNATESTVNNLTQPAL